ncbi:hypothetical protein VaNZ11_009296 [Volvox africanus]|uniref:FAD dependent oxidoreductase domain-containing protein n=1 Tax=Volvox africanus TaxID=51714 RepID=A0ABQ5S8D2_9CHLO|nr:hypothetical protein VaNZ11_009296 [Volvox africanus]
MFDVMSRFRQPGTGGRQVHGISGCGQLVPSRQTGWVLSCTNSIPIRTSTSSSASRSPATNAAGGRNAGGVSFSSAASTVLERRAADVAVLGSSCIAFAAAYSLARRGKKVVLIPDLGITAAYSPGEMYRPLHLPHPDAAMVSLSAEAAAYWRGLQAQTSGSGRQVVSETRSLDLSPLRRTIRAVRGAEGATQVQEGVEEVHGRLQDACKAAGARLGSLRGEELSALFPPLRLSGGEVGMLQPDGGVLDSSATQDLLITRGVRQQAGGLMLRDRLVLRGWRDEGSHFVIRASGSLAPGALSFFEVEQVLLAPEGWPRQALRLFGADAELQVVQTSSAMCAGTTELSSVPIWRHFGGPRFASGDGGSGSGCRGKSSMDGPEELLVVSGFPAQLASRGSSSASFKLGLCLPDARSGVGDVAARGGSGGCNWGCDPWVWQPGAPDRPGLLSAHRQANRLLRGVGPPVLQPPRFLSAPYGAAAAVTPALVSDVHNEWGDVALHTATRDGWPVLGFLPGMEPGRFVFACTASCCDGSGNGHTANVTTDAAAMPAAGMAAACLAAAGDGRRGRSVQSTPFESAFRSDAGTRGVQHQQSGSQQNHGKEQEEGQLMVGGWLLNGRPVLHDGYQLSPLLAKMAVDLLCGAARLAEVDSERVSLDRPALGAHARTEKGSFDPWDGLRWWQDGSGFQREAEAEAAKGKGMDVAEALEWAEAVVRGAKMLGRDAAELEEDAKALRSVRDPKALGKKSL